MKTEICRTGVPLVVGALVLSMARWWGAFLKD
jgi:hypothetical protein